MTPEERIKRHELTAKTQKKYVPVATRAKNIQDAIKKMQRQLQGTNKSLSKINSSQATNPTLKKMRINKIKALQRYITASIMLDQARLKQLKNPK